MLFPSAVLLLGLGACRQAASNNSLSQTQPEAAVPSSASAPEATSVRTQAPPPPLLAPNGLPAYVPPPPLEGPLRTEPNDDPNWAHPFLYQFAGYGGTRPVEAIGALRGGPVLWFGRSLVWNSEAPPGPPAALFHTCTGCQFQFLVDEPWSIHQTRGGLVHIALDSGEAKNTPAPRGHGGHGPLAQDKDYIYTSGNDCHSIVRYKKLDLSAETQVLSLAAGGGRGRRVLRVRPDGSLLCSGPGQILFLDRWGGTERLLVDARVDGVVALYSMDASSDTLFWVDRLASNTEPPIIGYRKLAGDAERHTLKSSVIGGDYNDGCVVPGTQKFLVPQMRTLEVFDGDLGAFIEPVQLEGRPHTLNCGPDAVYVGVNNTQERGPAYGLSDSRANWTARIPYSVFQ